jgi:choline dehydrogenase-like flavoprotein
MSCSSDESGVVDENLLVKGAEGLRIVDASVFVSDAELKTGKLIYSFQ